MAIFQFWAGAKEDTDSMAARKASAEVNENLAASYSESLVEAGADRDAFQQVIQRLRNDRAAGPAEFAIIAHNFGVSGKTLKSKTAAIAAIEKRFVEIIRFHKKNRVAAGTKPW